MHDAATVLRAWEAAADRPGPLRGATALAVLHGAGVDRPLTEVAAAAVACLRESAEAVDGVLDCPGCGGLLDVRIRLAELGGGEAVPDVAGARFSVRSPTPLDMAVAAAAGVEAREVLLRRCVVRVGGDAVAWDGLSAAELAEVDAALEVVAGAAMPVLRTGCPDCGVPVTGTVDVVELLWRRVRDDAGVVLRDVARLASAFGWREEDVLGLSSARRAAYLELAER